jgi:hypothetical protein
MEAFAPALTLTCSKTVGTSFVGRHRFYADGGVYVSPMLRGAGLFTKAARATPRIRWPGSVRGKWRSSLIW